MTLWHALPPEQARVLQGLLAEWASQQEPELAVRLVRSLDEETLHQKLLAAIQTAMMPNLALVRPSDIVSYVEADALLPLDPLAESEGVGQDEGDEDYFSAFFDAARYAGGLYGWPVHRHETLLFVNRQVVEEMGGTLPIREWEELVSLCATYRTTHDDTCLNAFPTGDVAVLWLWNHGGQVVDSTGTQPAFQGEAGRSMMRWLAALRAVGGVQIAPTYDAKVDAFADGHTWFTFDSTAAMPLYEERINDAFDMAVLPPPSLSGTPILLATGGNVAVFRSEPAMEALATDALRFWTSAQVNGRWAEAMGAYPVRRTALAQMEAQWPEDSHLSQAADWLPRARSEPLLRQWPAIEQALAEALIATINGQSTPDEALNEAVRRTQGLLQP